VHVSAKDLGTGKEQSIAITASSNMSEEEIEKAVKEAEQFAAEDKKNKEQAETFNQADQLIYQTEKTMKDAGDKLDPADKAKLESELNTFKQVRQGNNVDEIKAAMETFSKATYEVFGKMYQQANPNGGQGFDPNNPGQNPGGGANVNDDGTVESEFTD
ncbi:MAG: Hsp70 family protein, partial [Clostridia bacterium]|nr:Hsp70 family protein [Clostridia bacterium]